MKKHLVCAMLGLFILGAPLYAGVDGRTEHGAGARPAIVFFRGVGNLIGMPAEIYTTLHREVVQHSRIWPISYPFRLLTNIFVRTASGVNDLFILPWIVPFTDDISPITEPMGLPEYPWLVNP